MKKHLVLLKKFILAKNSLWLFLIILLVSTFFRVWNLGENPLGFFADEAEIGYLGYLVLHNPEFSKFQILFRNIDGTVRLPVMVYSQLPFIALFGLSVWSVRLTAAVYGILTVVVFYFIGKEIFKTKQAGLATMLVIGLMPWHIHLSRINFELISFIFWSSVSLWLILKFKNSKSELLIFFMIALCLLLVFLSYHTGLLQSWVFFPLIFIVKPRKKTFYLLLIYCLFLSWLFLELIKLGLLSRFFQVNSAETNLNLGSLIKAYFNHFSLEFLFLKGDIDFPGQFITRHSMRGLGELPIFYLIFIVLGFVYFMQHKKLFNYFIVVLLMLFVYPFGSMLLTENPFATRSSFGIIPFTVLTSSGILYLFSIVKKKQLRLSLAVFLAVVFCFYSVFLFKKLRDYPLYSSDFWGFQYGFQQGLEILKQNEDKYDALYITHFFNNPLILFSFFNESIKCSKCKIASNPVAVNLDKKELFVIRPVDLSAVISNNNLNYKIIDSILLPNRQVELVVVEFSQKQAM
ncbi:MAG: hypothetical protein KatS3mg091_361 [Patescibacteria group bacterium]|nr:MAG: hypothetical protein KatS3mg091_361 [Patescibacteria group bacterium]